HGAPPRPGRSRSGSSASAPWPPMARNLLRAGFPVHVRNPQPRARDAHVTLPTTARVEQLYTAACRNGDGEDDPPLLLHALDPPAAQPPHPGYSPPPAG